eukprot:contig_2330_g432
MFNRPAECKDFGMNPNLHPHARSGSKLKSKLAEINAKMHPVLQNFNQSGRNDPSAWNELFNGDQVLNYMYGMYRDSDMHMNLVCKELDGGAGSGSASFLPPDGAPTGAVIFKPASRRLSTTPAAVGKGHQRERTSLLSAMVAFSATIAESSRRRLPSSMVSDLVQALESAKAAGSSDMIIDALEKQMLECINKCGAEISTAKRARLAAD